MPRSAAPPPAARRTNRRPAAASPERNAGVARRTRSKGTGMHSATERAGAGGGPVLLLGESGGPAPRGGDREEEDRQAEATQVSGQTPQRCVLLQRNQNHGLGACRVRHKCLYCPSSGQGWRPAGGPAGRRAARRWPGWAHRWAASRVKAAGEGLSCSEAPAKDWQPRSCRGHQPWWDAAVLLQGHGAIIHTLLCLFHTARSAPRW